MDKSFLSTITRKELAAVGVLLAAPFLTQFLQGLCTMGPLSPAYLSMLVPVVLNIIGTSSGIAIIGRSIGGASVRTPSIMMKGLIGIVICEANMIFSMLSFFFLREKADALKKLEGTAGVQVGRKEIQAAWTMFCSGAVCGMCGLIASLGSSVANAASSIAIASNAKVFSKLVSLQLIIGGIGALGLIASLLFLRVCPEISTDAPTPVSDM
ncbi:V-type H+-transporting ATPase 21kDa proteolipid subunit [Nematocida sp. AWRm77]|nr:V-type H+-transporting ATPase 21kDa proteolipid subunit [Nematocida sp. AWRm77]